MTVITQADPPSETQQLADARIAIAQGMVVIKELEDWLTQYRTENDKARKALGDIRRVALRYDGGTQLLLRPILDIANEALRKRIK